MDLGLEGRTALVLGATSGIGAAIAGGLGSEGANVVVVGRNVERAEQVATALPRAIAVPADLNDPEAPARIVAAAMESFGHIDILVLNGGGPAPGTASAMGPGQADDAIGALVRPHVALVQEALPGMTARGWGRIIAVGSSGVQQPIANLAASNVGRAALAGYLKTLSAEVASSGVTVNMVLPGRIDTDRVTQLDRSDGERAGVTTQEARQRSESRIPARRYGSPEEFAAVAVFLAGGPASYITGEQIRCDGGLVGHH